MKSVSGKQLCRLLERKGWILARITGSQHIYTRPGIAVRITVPVHGNHDLKIGLLRAILKIAAIDESEL